MGRPSDARQRLVRAAVKAIFAHSYASVSVDELCAQAEVTKSSFYHFFPSKHELALVAMDAYWQNVQHYVLEPAFTADVSPRERLLRFFDLVYEGQRNLWEAYGYLVGCMAGNLTLEMGAQDEVFRVKLNDIFNSWSGYIEQAVREEMHLEGASTLDPATRAQAMLAYLEGVLLLAKSRNDPELIKQLRFGLLSLLNARGNGQ